MYDNGELEELLLLDGEGQGEAPFCSHEWSAIGDKLGC